VKNYTFVRIALVFILLTSISLGGLDQSTGTWAKNLSMADFNALGLESNSESAIFDAGAPQAAAEDPGTEMAVYADQAPPMTDLKRLLPSSVLTKPPSYMYIMGTIWDGTILRPYFPATSRACG
jgi:hypothetical protein